MKCQDACGTSLYIPESGGLETCTRPVWTQKTWKIYSVRQTFSFLHCVLHRTQKGTRNDRDYRIKNKDIKIIIITLFHIFKKLERIFNMSSGNIVYLEKTQVELKEIKTLWD